MGVTNEEAGPTRRTVLAGAGAAGVALTLAACSSDSGSDGGGAGATTGGAGPAIKTGDIPVGSGKVYESQKVVVTQPTAGQFKAFSAVCTHQGCFVRDISDGTIHCPCHGSAYSATDGSVKNGPATQPLAEKTVAVSGDTITVS
jgi:nitrite reductase/ring-hydroxylating ferredoxin subunit